MCSLNGRESFTVHNVQIFDGKDAFRPGAIAHATRLATEFESKLPTYTVFIKDDIVRQLVL